MPFLNLSRETQQGKPSFIACARHASSFAYHFLVPLPATRKLDILERNLFVLPVVRENCVFRNVIAEEFDKLAGWRTQ
jgi:hypothetical protein